MATIDAVLGKMRKAGKMRDMKEKGNLGEEAVLAICYDRKQKTGNGLLYQSFMYPYQTDRSGVCYTGNVMFRMEGDNPVFYEHTRESINDEIDVLYITPYRIFPIEVKSYHSRLIEVYDHWVNKSGEFVDKSPVMQAEKHARHLYHAIYDVLPDGDPKYIVPIVCFVDRCEIVDDREKLFKQYVPVCVLNNLLKTLNKCNQPLQYNLDITEIERKLNEVKVSIKQTL